MAKDVTTTSVQRKVWGPDDTYYVVEVQIDSEKFKNGEKVKVTIESED